MANITAVEAAGAIPEMWLASAIDYLRASLVLGSRVRRDASDEIQEQGDTVNVMKLGAVTVNEKTAGNPVTPSVPVTSKVAVVLDKHVYSAWHLEDYASAVGYRRGLAYAQQAAGKIAEHIESSLQGLHTTIASEVGTGGAGLSKAVILEARKQLNVQKAPMMGRLLSVSPIAETDLLGLDEFVSAERVGDAEAIRMGSIGRIFGFDVLMSQLVKETAGTQHNIACHPDAFMLASRALPMPEDNSGAAGSVMIDPVLNIALRYTRQWDSNELKTKHVIDCLYGVKEVDEDRLAVEVLS